jgi:hypothetical protein
MLTLEKKIAGVCHYVNNVVLSKDEKGDPIAMVFPDKKLLAQPDYKLTPAEGCFCPRSLDELGKCLSGCLKTVNTQLAEGVSKIKSAYIINVPLPSKNQTDSASAAIIEKYKKLLREKHGDQLPASEEIYFIKNDY